MSTIDREAADRELMELVNSTEDAIKEFVQLAMATQGLGLEQLYIHVILDSQGQQQILVVDRNDIAHLESTPGFDALLAKPHQDDMARVLYQTPRVRRAGYLFLGPPMSKGGDA